MRIVDGGLKLVRRGMFDDRVRRVDESPTVGALSLCEGGSGGRSWRGDPGGFELVAFGRRVVVAVLGLRLGWWEKSRLGLMLTSKLTFSTEEEEDEEGCKEG